MNDRVKMTMRWKPLARSEGQRTDKRTVEEIPNQDERIIFFRIIYSRGLSKAADKSRSVRQLSDFLMTHSFDDMIMNGKKSSFSRMLLDI